MPHPTVKMLSDELRGLLDAKKDWVKAIYRLDDDDIGYHGDVGHQLAGLFYFRYHNGNGDPDPDRPPRYVSVAHLSWER